jgi:hypothetical protein
LTLVLVANAVRHCRKPIILAAAYVLVALVVLCPLSLHPASRLPDDGDALQGSWILWWSATHLGSADLFGGNIYYPHPAALAYSEPLLSQAVMAWPLFRLFDNRVLVVNLVTIASLGLSAFAAHLLLRELTGSGAAAAVGAVAYAFSDYSLSNLPRLQLVSLQWMPLALLALHRFFATGRPRHAWAWALFTVLHGLACFYYLSFYAVALVLVLPAYLVASGSWRVPRMVLALVAAGVAGATVLAAVAMPYMRLFHDYGFSGEAKSADLLGYFVPPARTFLYRGVVASLPDPFGPRFLGYAAMALGVLGIAAIGSPRFEDRWKIVRIAYVLLGMAAFLLSGGPELMLDGVRLGSGPFALLREIEPFGKLRSASRFTMLVNLAVGLMVAHGTALLLARLSRPRLSALGLALAIAAEHWSPAYTEGVPIPVGTGVPEAYRWLASRPAGEPVAELPSQRFRFIRFDALDAYFSTLHRQPTLWGKPSFYPPALEVLRWDLRNFPDALSITLLRAIGVRWALVHPKRWQEGQRFAMRRVSERGDLLPFVEAFPDREDAVWAHYLLGGEQLHSLPPLESEGQPRACECREVDRSGLRVHANGANAPTLGLDGRRDTKWTTAEGQQAGHSYEVAFNRPRRAARIEIEMATPYGEFARNLEIIGFLGAQSSKVDQRPDIWYEVALVRQLVKEPMRARLRYDLQPEVVDRLRLQIAETEQGTGAWSIPEIHIYELDEASRR